MLEDRDEIIEGTRKRVAEMRLLTDQTARLLGDSKRAVERLEETDLQVRHQQEQARDENQISN